MKENNHTEFKRSFSDAVIESLVAFANAKGGTVFIGLDNSGNPLKNFKIGNESLQNWVNEIKNKTQPSIISEASIIQIKGFDVASFTVFEFPVKPVAFRGRYFKRINNSNHLLSAMEIADLSLKSLQISWDSYEKYGKTISDLDLEKVSRFVEKVNETGRFILDGVLFENLEKLKLVNGNAITNAAWLLFSKENIDYNIHLGRFKTSSYIIDDKMLNGTLFEMVEECMKYIISHIKVAFEIKGMPTKRTEIFEYPLPALRELVLNALIHRDYLSPVDVQIKIFDNKIDFFNPGTLFGSLTVADLKKDNYQAYARNKLIAEAFYLTGDIEKYGSGFLRIRKEIKSYSTMELNFAEIPNGFLSSLNYEEQKISTNIAREDVRYDRYEGVSEGLIDGSSHNFDLIMNGIEKNIVNLKNDEGVSEGVNKLLSLISSYPGRRLPFFTEKMKVPSKTIERWLKILRDKNYIIFIGASRNGGYFKTDY